MAVSSGRKYFKVINLLFLNLSFLFLYAGGNKLLDFSALNFCRKMLIIRQNSESFSGLGESN